MGPGASHGLIASLDALAARPGHQLTYPVGWALGERKRAAIGQVPPDTWLIAIGTHGEVRERPADDACPILAAAIAAAGSRKLTSPS